MFHFSGEPLGLWFPGATVGHSIVTWPRPKSGIWNQESGSQDMATSIRKPRIWNPELVLIHIYIWWKRYKYIYVYYLYLYISYVIYIFVYILVYVVGNTV